MNSKSTECHRAESEISEYIDGLLPQERAWKLQMHLSICSRCSAEARGVRGIVDLLQGLPAAKLSPNFDSELATKLAPFVNSSKRAAPVFRRLVLWLHAVSVRWSLGGPSVAAAAGATVAVAIVLMAAFVWTNPTIPSHTRSTALPAALPSAAPDDLAFVAACANQHAQYQSLKPIADPTAQIVAERVDASESASAPQSAAQPAGDADDADD